MRPDNRNPSAGQEAQTARRKLFSLSLLHIANDLHAGVLPTIIPMLAQSISLTLAQAGALNSVFGILHIFCQPAFGFIADRQKKPYGAVIGPVLCAAGACLLPLAPSFGAAIFFVALLGTGTAMFHPQGTGLCGEAAGERNLAFFISIFAAFGTLGSAFGPVYVVYVVGALGRKGLPFMVLPVVLVCAYAFKNLVLCDNRGENSAPGREGLGKFLRGAGSIISKIGGIIAIATLRDATNLGIRLFLPTLAVLQGGTNKQGGQLVFCVTLASAISAMVGGRYAARIGYTKILIGGLSLSPLFLLAALYTRGAASVLMLLLGFALLTTSSSVTTAMSQQRCPDARSTVSSLSMGLSWGLANLFTSPVGWAADHIGLLPVLRLVALIPWIITAYYLAVKYRRGK